MLLDAALDTLAPTSQAWVETLGYDLQSYLERSSAEKEVDAQLATSMLETALEFERLTGETAPRPQKTSLYFRPPT